MTKEISTHGWVSLELWDNTLEECITRWNHNKWGLSKDNKNNIKDVFFYGIQTTHENKLEIFTFSDSYIFIELNNVEKLPPQTKIPGSVDWVRIKKKPVSKPIIFPDNEISSIKDSVNTKIETIVDSFKEGKKARVIDGLYKGMEGIVSSKNKINIKLNFYLNSRNFEADLPFWFLQRD